MKNFAWNLRNTFFAENISVVASWNYIASTLSFKIGLIQTFLNNILDSQQVSRKFWNTVSFHVLKLVAFKTSSCICIKVSLRNSTCNILLQLSKGKRGNVISGVLERECIELMRERPSRDPRVSSLHRFRARFYKNTFGSLHLHLHILRFLFLST